MKKVFLALMAIATIAFTGCKKDDPKQSQEELDLAVVTAAKAALGTDGKGLVEALKNAGYRDVAGDGIYRNGDEYCNYWFEGDAVSKVTLKIQAFDFSVAKSHFLRMETASAPVFPSGFEGECQLGEDLSSFTKEEEFLSSVTQVTADKFTETWNGCRARSDFNDDLIRENFLKKTTEPGLWVSHLDIWVAKE